MQIDGQIIFLILFVLIGAVKWIVEQIQERRNGQDPHDVNETLEEMYDDFREEIRRRQTEVEQPQQPAHAPPPLPTQQTQTTAPPPVPNFNAPASARPQNFKVNQPKLSAAEKQALENFQDRGKRNRKKKHAPNMGSIRAMLADPTSAQKAIILKEILGEPRSMQRI